MKKIIKFTAVLTVFSYLATGTGFAQPAASLTVLPPTSPEINADREIIRIPENLGSIQVQHQSGKDSPLIIFIQDAHAVVDAQNHIQEIIRHFQQTYGIRVIALEGAAGGIDPTLFRTFPDSFIKQKVLTDYLKRGELTGAEMAAGLNPLEGTYHGIEDWDLYQKHYLAHLKAVEKKEAVLKVLTGIRKTLDVKREKVYSATLNEFYNQLRSFEKENAHLLELLSYLVQIKKGDGSIFSKYSDLEKLYRSFEFEKEGERKNQNIESYVRQMADRFKANYVKRMNIKQEMTFHRSYQLFVTGQMETGQFLKYLVETGESFGVKARLTPTLLKVLGHSETLGTIKGTKLFDELQSFTREIEDTLIATPQEREIADKYRRLTLLEDLANLELTREQLEQYEKIPGAYWEIGDGSILESNKENRTVPYFLQDAVEFYRLAVTRDEAFHTNLKKLLETQKADAAIVVAGGFHSHGFETNLKKAGYSYAVITPAIQSLEGQETYAEVMQGKLSYEPQFKTTFYDAFIKHSSVKLISEFNETDFRRNIKLWRDEIIRKLSNEGRITEAGEYLRYLDLLFKVYNEKFGSGIRVEKSKEEILKAVENELAQFKKETLPDLWRQFSGQVKPATLGAPLALTKVGFDSPDLISWQNTGRPPLYSLRAEVRQPVIRFDLDKTVKHIVGLFEKDETRKSLPTLRELSDALGPSHVTFSRYFDEILDGLKGRISDREFDPELRKRIKETIASIPERKEKRKSVAFDLDKTVEQIVGLFKKDETRKALPILRELSDALGSDPVTFSNHFDEILEGLNEKISERGFDSALRKRIRDAIGSIPDRKEPKERVTFDLDKTVEHVVGLFESDESRKGLPTQAELSDALGPNQSGFSRYFDEILERLKARIGERGFDPELRKRIKDSIESIPERKESVAFDLDKTVEHIVGLFSQDETRKELPTQAELSDALAPSRMTFSNHFDEILNGLTIKINEQGFDSELRKRIKDVIESIPERKERRESVAFDLDKTVEHIVGLFSQDETRKVLPSQRELSGALGPNQSVFSRRFDEILDGLKARISERGFDPELRKRIEDAIAHRAEVRTDNAEATNLKRLATAGALELAAFWQDSPQEEKPDILKIEVGKIPVKAIKVNLEQYVSMSETRAPPSAGVPVVRSEVRSSPKIPTATEVYQSVIQTDEFLNSRTLKQALAESEKIDLLLDQEQARIIPYISHHLTDKGRAVQLVLEKVMDRLINAPELDSPYGQIYFARISLFPATYKQIKDDTLADDFKDFMLEAFRKGAYFAGASAYADGPQLVILDVPIGPFREKYPEIWNEQLDKLIEKYPEIKGHKLLKGLRKKHFAAYSIIRLPSDDHDEDHSSQKALSKALIPVEDENVRKARYKRQGKDRDLIPLMVAEEYAWDYRKWLRAKLKEARLGLKMERQKLKTFEGTLKQSKNDVEKDERATRMIQSDIAESERKIKRAYDEVTYYAQEVTLAADLESVARVEAVEKMPKSLKDYLTEKLSGFNPWLFDSEIIKEVRGYLKTADEFELVGEFYKSFIVGRDRLVPPGEYPSGRIPRLSHMMKQLEIEESPYSLANVRIAWNELKKAASEENLKNFYQVYAKYQSARNEMIVRSDRDIRMPGIAVQTSGSGEVKPSYTPYLYKEAFLDEVYQAARNGSLGKFKRHLAQTELGPLAETISETLILGKRSIGDEFYGAVLVKSDDGQDTHWLPLGGEYDGFNAWNKQYPPDKEDHMDAVFHEGVALALSDRRARKVANGPAPIEAVLDFLQAWTDNMRKPGTASKPFFRTVKYYPGGKEDTGADFQRPGLFKKRGSDIHQGPLYAKGTEGKEDKEVIRKVDLLTWKAGEEIPEDRLFDQIEPVESLLSATFTLDERPLKESENLMKRMSSSDGQMSDTLEKWNDLQKKLHGKDGLSGKAATVKQVETMALERGLALPSRSRSEVRTTTEAERFSKEAIHPVDPKDRPKLTQELKDLVDKKLTLNGPFGIENVLSAEDQAFVQQPLKLAFQNEKIGTLEIVPHGTAALEVLKSKAIKLLLTDVNMPGGKSGDELIFDLRKTLNSNIPVMVLSSDSKAQELPSLFNNVIYILAFCRFL